MNYPVYIVGSAAFIDAVRRAFVMDSIDNIERVVNEGLGPYQLLTLDGQMAFGETPAQAFHNLVSNRKRDDDLFISECCEIEPDVYQFKGPHTTKTLYYTPD